MSRDRRQPSEPGWQVLMPHPGQELCWVCCYSPHPNEVVCVKFSKMGSHETGHAALRRASFLCSLRSSILM